MDVTKTHGAPSWSELTTPDPAAAATFYAALFGWTVTAPMAEMGDYRLAQIGETSVAGIMAPPPGAAAMPPQWGCYVTVSDVDATVAKVVELGGTVLVPPMEVPGVGRMAVFQDPQGATLSVMTYAA